MAKASLRQSAKEAAIGTGGLLLFGLWAGGSLLAALYLSAAGYPGLAILWLVMVIFVTLTVGRWLHDRL